MSNINSPNAWHGLDDEPQEYAPDKFWSGCNVCYSQAKTQFFARKYHRRGETLQKLYIQIHQEAHS